MTGGFAALPVVEEGGDSSQQWLGSSRILGPRWARFAALTVGLFGVQVFWSVEMSYASPYILSLGVSKSHMALVFVAGPISGLIVQPLVGVLADNCKSRFGRRRPYMMLGCTFCVFAMLLLGFTRQFASLFTTIGSAANDNWTMWLAVLAIYFIDFPINAVQAVDRALLVDTLPGDEQAQGNAWAAQMLGIGSVVGFFIGNVDLPAILPWLGKTQLEVLAVLASLLLFGAHAVTSALVKEKVLLSSNKKGPSGLWPEMKLLWANARTLPPVIRQICFIQFFAWIGWFPILFYLTTYVNELYKRSQPAPTSAAEAATLDVTGTRLGTRALFFSAILTVITNLAAPFIVRGARTHHRNDSPHEHQNGDSAGHWEVKQRGVMERAKEAVGKVPVPKIHLATLWAVSHFLFAGCMVSTFFVSSVHAATIMGTLTGFAWAITQWAPFSLIGEAILSSSHSAPMDDGGSIRLADARRSGEDERDERSRFLRDGHGSDDSGSGVESEDEDEGRGRSPRNDDNAVFGNASARQSRSEVNIEDEHEHEIDARPSASGGDLSAKAGIILGIHNVFIVIPQFLVTALASIIFALFEPDKSVLHGHHPGPGQPVHNVPPTNTTTPTVTSSAAVVSETARAVASVLLAKADEDWDGEWGEENTTGPNSVAFIFRVGGVAAFVAFVLTLRLSRMLQQRPS